MTFRITGLSAENFAPYFGQSDDVLAAQGIVRTVVTGKPGFPCRITLEDAEPGETVLLLNHASHDVATPYRSAYAIYVREGAMQAADYVDEIPPVMSGRPLALRLFDTDGMLVGAELVLDGAVKPGLERALARSDVAYIDVHNAAHGCFAARVRRS
ncbi:DUF1203 domain-containing protein [Maricaulis parjimensis]|uniref:DUF1203 domain-containing protein n=1 Tax=Maricaulis parjimensis TaxID=144023 RepID=UPI00193A6E49|nr:DUF1203 domain-containing protein [Maricaulis parjimensis]